MAELVKDLVLVSLGMGYRCRPYVYRTGQQNG